MRRLSYMPWLYFRLKAKHQAWARPWQARIQDRLAALETIEFGEGCFVAPEARLFAEPGRPIRVADGASIAAECFVHGPVDLGEGASLNVGVVIDGGRAGVHIGAGTRIGSGAKIFAFDHQVAADRPIAEQPVRSRGIRIGRDVWIGAGAGLTDGVTLGDGAVVGMGAVVTQDVPPGVAVAGVPARAIGQRGEGPALCRLPEGDGSTGPGG